MYSYSIVYLHIYIVLYVLRFKVTITSIVVTVMEVHRSTSITAVTIETVITNTVTAVNDIEYSDYNDGSEMAISI